MAPRVVATSTRSTTAGNEGCLGDLLQGGCLGCGALISGVVFPTVELPIVPEDSEQNEEVEMVVSGPGGSVAGHWG